MQQFGSQTASPSHPECPHAQASSAVSAPTFLPLHTCMALCRPATAPSWFAGVVFARLALCVGTCPEVACCHTPSPCTQFDPSDHLHILQLITITDLATVHFHILRLTTIALQDRPPSYHKTDQHSFSRRHTDVSAESCFCSMAPAMLQFELRLHDPLHIVSGLTFLFGQGPINPFAHGVGTLVCVGTSPHQSLCTWCGDVDLCWDKPPINPFAHGVGTSPHQSLCTWCGDVELCLGTSPHHSLCT